MLIAIVILYFVLMGAVGLALKKRNKTVSDFLIAGRKLGFVLTMATLAGVQIGAGIVLGSAETAAANGLWPGTWYGLGCGFGLILAGLLVASRLRSVDGFVPLDFFGRRYGENRWVRLWAWASNIPSLLGIFVAQVMAAAYVLSIFGFRYHYALALVGCVILIYSVFGGMWAIASLSVIQVGILMIGIPVAALMTLPSMHDLGLIEKLASQPFIPAGMGSKFVFLILPFLLSISISYDAYVRYQSAVSGRVARWGCVAAGLIVIFITLCTAVVGAAGRQMFPGLPAAFVLPHVIQAKMHAALAGIVVAALLGAAMASGTGVLISLAGCFSRDFYNKVLHPNQELDELKHANTVARSVIILTLLIGLLIAFRSSNLLFTMIILNYPYMGSMLVPLLGGVLWRGATSQGATAAMVVGGAIGCAAFLAGIPGPFRGFMNYDLGLLIAWLASAVAFVIVSLITAKRPQVYEYSESEGKVDHVGL